MVVLVAGAAIVVTCTHAYDVGGAFQIVADPHVTVNVVGGV